MFRGGAPSAEGAGRSERHEAQGGAGEMIARCVAVASLTVALDYLERGELDRALGMGGKLSDGAQAGLDATSERDLLVAAEQRHPADLFEVHPHIVGRQR